MSDSDGITDVTFSKDINEQCDSPKRPETPVSDDVPSPPPVRPSNRPKKPSKTKVKVTDLVVCTNSLSDKVDKLNNSYDVLLLSYTKMMKKYSKLVNEMGIIQDRMDKCKKFCYKIYDIVTKITPNQL